MYKQDLALNNLEWLICHKTLPKPTPSPGAGCNTRSISQ